MLLHCHCPVPKDGGIVCMPASLSGQDWAVAGDGFCGARSTTKFGASQNDRLVNRSNNLGRPSSATIESAWNSRGLGSELLGRSSIPLGRTCCLASIVSISRGGCVVGLVFFSQRVLWVLAGREKVQGKKVGQEQKRERWKRGSTCVQLCCG